MLVAGVEMVNAMTQRNARSSDKIQYGSHLVVFRLLPIVRTNLCKPSQSVPKGACMHFVTRFYIIELLFVNALPLLEIKSD